YLQERLVSPMDTIIIADGNHGATALIRNGLVVENCGHCSCQVRFSAARARTLASPSITTVLPTLATQAIVTRRRRTSMSVISTVTVTVSPSFTGARKFRVCDR